MKTIASLILTAILGTTATGCVVHARARTYDSSPRHGHYHAYNHCHHGHCR